MCLRMGTRKESDHCTWRPNSVSPSICNKKTNDGKVKEKFKDFTGGFRMDYKCLITLNLIWDKIICDRKIYE